MDTQKRLEFLKDLLFDIIVFPQTLYWKVRLIKAKIIARLEFNQMLREGRCNLNQIKFEGIN